MDAPKCQKIPSCGKRHYGECGTDQAPRPSKAARRKQPARPEKKSAEEARLVGTGELLARIESLEARVLELESRKKYMRDYQARRRAEKKSGGSE